MDEIENVDPKYVEGFNQGYYLAKHAPDLAAKLTGLPNNTERLTGMKEGIEQYVLEQSKDKMPDWLKKDRLKNSRQQGKDLDRE